MELWERQDAVASAQEVEQRGLVRTMVVQIPLIAIIFGIAAAGRVPAVPVLALGIVLEVLIFWRWRRKTADLAQKAARLAEAEAEVRSD